MRKHFNLTAEQEREAAAEADMSETALVIFVMAMIGVAIVSFWMVFFRD